MRWSESFCVTFSRLFCVHNDLNSEAASPQHYKLQVNLAQQRGDIVIVLMNLISILAAKKKNKIKTNTLLTPDKWL